MKCYTCFVQVCYKNSELKGDGVDYRELWKSLPVAMNTAKKYEQDIEDVIVSLIKELGIRELPVPENIK